MSANSARSAMKVNAPTRRGHATRHAIGGARRCRPTQCSYKEPGAFPSCSSSGNNSALDFPSRNPRSTAGHRSGIPCRASQRNLRNALPISSSALLLGTPRASSAFTVSRTSSFSRIKLRATLAISLLGPGMVGPVLKDGASRKTARGGGPLDGNKLMRLTYVDEGGIAKHEGFMVVSGAIIDGDRQLVAIENHLDILVQKHIPEEDRPGFIFHATEIWSGGGYFKDRNKWP